LKIVVDTHTHTVSSGHGYSTIQEMASQALINGIQMFAVTDHGPSMCGAPCLYHFGNLKVIPEKINGVRILKGAEANIINYKGEIDIPPDYLNKLDLVLASFHEICIKPSNIDDHTDALISIIKNPLIDAVAHPGNPQYQVDIDKVVKSAGEHNKLIEINNHSFKGRTGSEENCRVFIKKCMEYSVRIICGSDAHISFDVGKFDKLYKLFKELNMPEELILNTSVKKFDEYLEEKKRRV
jgi:putative hydrolase